MLLVSPLVEALAANDWIGIVNDGAIFAVKKDNPWKYFHTDFDWPHAAFEYGDRFRILDNVATWTSVPSEDNKHTLETWADRRGIDITKHNGNDGAGWKRSTV